MRLSELRVLFCCQELTEVVSVAREVCDDRGSSEVSDEVIVDETIWPTNATKLLKK